ncbi:DUF4007 family protein [Paraburkholderia terrae]|uniref:DUF4007 family protein n=1 Tax=Paraburkholderia caribensis TaxID=75105 RepID=A0A9Q6WL75_9BURK|nr:MULTISPECIES: DUF4007 family protein [Paraburkholderia]MCO4875588.1 DUF4007 family protein [Paraburkholderia caribensis]MDW3658704.1 DUF4007 family protein [Paraburkholderia terrae]PTB30492.1 DUF4007 domain-containing protein [Paraburkholderia caribensis]QLB62266.1 hypothetical protein A9O66_07655 [Paraburkholderia caribensis]
MSNSVNERFSGHESFVCRYGWLPKVFKAVVADPGLLRNDERAMAALGIGRNMVKSIQFWGEATGVLLPAGSVGHLPGPVGALLFDEKDGLDPYLESIESLWLIHWQLCVTAGLAAWKEVFAEGGLIRFDRQRLVAALARRGEANARPLAASTLEQHASIFVQTYYQEERGADDTSWCPLQDLGLLRATKEEDGKVMFSADPRSPVGLTLRVFGIALVQFIRQKGEGTQSVDFNNILRGAGSPGLVFRLDEHQLRVFIENLCNTMFAGALRFVDTADTQSVVLNPEQLDPQFRLQAAEEAYPHV